MNEYFLGCYTLTLFQLAAVHDKSNLLPTSFHCSFSQNVPSSPLFVQIPCTGYFIPWHFLKLDLFFLPIISHQVALITWGFVRGPCRRNGTDDPKKHRRERTRRFSVKNRSPKAMWTSRRAERVQPLEFASQWSRPNCSRAKVRWNSSSFYLDPEAGRFEWSRPAIGWDWLTVTMTSLHWLSRACHTTWLPEDRPFPLYPSLCHPFHPLACRSTGLGKNCLQDMQKRERFFY